MSSVAPALAPTNIISIILNSSQHQAVTLPKQMVRTCASCCVQQAQPFRVLGRNVPAQPSGSAQRPSPGTASASLLGSVPRTPGGTAASGTRPGFLLGCGPSRSASRHPAGVITIRYLTGASSGQHHPAGFSRPSVNVATFIIPLQDCRIVPFQPHASIPYGQGTVANESEHSTLPKFGHVRYIFSIVCNKRHGTQPVLHSSARLPLHHPSVLSLHHARVTRPRTACLGALSIRARLARRARHSGTSVFRLPLHYGRSPRPRLWASSLPSPPVCILQPTEPVPPTYCRPASASGVPAALAESLTFPLRRLSDEIRRRYGGATFEIKRCSSFSPGGIYNRCSCCSSAVNPP